MESVLGPLAGSRMLCSVAERSLLLPRRRTLIHHSPQPEQNTSPIVSIVCALLFTLSLEGLYSCLPRASRGSPRAKRNPFPFNRFRTLSQKLPSACPLVFRRVTISVLTPLE